MRGVRMAVLGVGAGPLMRGAAASRADSSARERFLEAPRRRAWRVGIESGTAANRQSKPGGSRTAPSPPPHALDPHPTPPPPTFMMDSTPASTVFSSRTTASPSTSSLAASVLVVSARALKIWAWPWASTCSTSPSSRTFRVLDWFGGCGGLVCGFEFVGQRGLASRACCQRLACTVEGCGLVCGGPTACAFANPHQPYQGAAPPRPRAQPTTISRVWVMSAALSEDSQTWTPPPWGARLMP